MAVDVSQETSRIRKAIYGKEVRASIADGIDAIAADANTFEQDLTQQQNSFENNITNKENNFENSMKDEQSNFEHDINNQFGQYKKEIDTKQSDYELKVDTEWSDYKAVMDSEESTRESNESTRQSNEQTRINNETARQQNELIRQTNEADRKTNETARETAFSNMEHVDANLELSTARGTYDSLGARLDNSEDETLANKELVTINHNFNSYPDVRCICGYYGAGMGAIDDNNPAGSDSYLINAKICYPDTSKVKIYVPSNYLVKSPLVQKLEDNKYLIASSDTSEIKSILITLQEVA